MTQDLFSFAGSSASPPVPTQPALPGYPVPRAAGSIAWERLLAQTGTDAVVFHVSSLWTGVVAEVATGAAIGRKAWDRSGSIVDLGPARGFEPGRLVYLTPSAASALHGRYPLVMVGKEGSAASRFRFARPGENASATPQILGRLAHPNQGIAP